MMQQPHYTVLGATGFVGSRLATTLRAAGATVWTPARDDASIFERDLGRVFYTIGLTADYAARPFDTVEAHVCLLSKLLKYGTFERLVYLSSTRLYDGQAIDVADETQSLLLNPLSPRHLYDFSKGLGENLCLTVAPTRCSVARLACVFDDADTAPGFLSELFGKLRRNRQLTVDSATGFVRDYIALDDVVDALCRIVDAETCGKIYNVASGENVSNGELAAHLATLGWTLGFTRESPKQQAPRCAIEAIQALGCQPRLVRDVLTAQLNPAA